MYGQDGKHTKLDVRKLTGQHSLCRAITGSPETYITCTSEAVNLAAGQGYLTPMST